MKLTPRQKQVLDALDSDFNGPHAIARKANITTVSPSETASVFCRQLVKLGLAEQGGKLLDQHLDRGVYIYVTNPPDSYDFPSERQLSGEGPRKVSVPKDAVFATYVDFSPRAIDELVSSSDYRGTAVPAGVVLYWAWTRASVLDRHLPHEYRTRYEQQVHP